MVAESMNVRRMAPRGPSGMLPEEGPRGLRDDAAWAPGPRTHPDAHVDEQRRRRRAAEAAAEAAEAAAADAASRASAAIAAAAQAAADAEAAANAAARASEEVETAAAAERRAVEQAHAAIADSANETTTVGGMAALAGNAQGPAGTALDGTTVIPPVVEDARSGSWQQAAGPPVPGQSLREQPVPEQSGAGPQGLGRPADDSVPTMTIPAVRTAGRAARRRAQEAAAAVALEATRDPETKVIGLGDGDDRRSGSDGARGSHSSRRSRREAAQGAANPVLKLVRRVRGGGRVVVAAAAVCGVIAVAAIVADIVGGSPTPTPAAVTESAPAAASVAAAPTTDPDASADPTSPKAVAYLKALRAADVPTSGSGQSETEAAAVICQQLARGTDAATLARALPAVLPTVDSKQAKTVVSIAQQKYCET
ncbi:MAG: hypothetical protein QOF00_4940 [Pseudonocardiales bacterium]|nr:hypothetical protein [Pseudonocardiales bacterium]